MANDLAPHYLLLGVGGSHAHGLAHDYSDFDHRGVHSFPTEAFFELGKMEALSKHSIVTTDPDSSSHELTKFLSLAIKGNPDVLEVLALDTFVDFDPEWGTRLLELTPAIISTHAIREAFIGYAKSQFHALEKRHAAGNDSFSAGMGSRTWKHAKHMFRLLEAGERILKTGKLTPRVEDRDWYLNVLPDLSIDQLLDLAKRRFEKVRLVESVIPEGRPDLVRINQFLVDYRKAH